MTAPADIEILAAISPAAGVASVSMTTAEASVLSPLLRLPC